MGLIVDWDQGSGGCRTNLAQEASYGEAVCLPGGK